MTDLLQSCDDYDGFCTCPSCGLVGTHSVEHTVFRTRTIPGADGDAVTVFSWGDPPDGTPLVRRTCTFCAHVWDRTAQEAA